MPTWNASKEIICAFHSLSGAMLMIPEVHQVYFDRPDLRFKLALMQASQMHRLMESGKSYSTAAAWEFWKQWGWDEHWAWNSQAVWKHLKSVFMSLESSANPCPRQWQSYLSSRHTHFGVPEAGSIDNSCCHCLFFICNIPRQSLHCVLPTASEVTASVSFTIFSKLRQTSSKS